MYGSVMVLDATCGAIVVGLAVVWAVATSAALHAITSIQMAAFAAALRGGATGVACFAVVGGWAKVLLSGACYYAWRRIGDYLAGRRARVSTDVDVWIRASIDSFTVLTYFELAWWLIPTVGSKNWGGYGLPSGELSENGGWVTTTLLFLAGLGILELILAIRGPPLRYVEHELSVPAAAQSLGLRQGE